MSEKWKVVKNYSNYSCTKSGKIKNNHTGRILNPKPAATGYLTLVLKNDNDKSIHTGIHRLIAETWIDNPDNKPTVNHINSVRTDNRIENLEWATYSKQNLHKSIEQKGNIKLNSNCGIWMCDKITEEKIKFFRTIEDATDYLGRKHGCGNIVSCAKGRITHVYGYKWKYDDRKFHTKEKNKPGEKWKCSQDTYYISNYGRLRNGNKYLSYHVNQDYLCYSIKGKQCRAHRLVAEKFVKNPKPDEYIVVNHIDGNKQNNHYKNLEWCTHSMNAKHSIKNGLNKSIIKIVNFDNNFNILKVYNTAKDAGDELGVDKSNIPRAYRGEQNIYDKNKNQLYFKYLDSTDDIKNKKVTIKKLPIKEKKETKNKVVRKKINVHDTKGNLIDTCNTRVEVAKKYDTNRNTVTQQCNKEVKYPNTKYRFSYAED